MLMICPHCGKQHKLDCQSTELLDYMGSHYCPHCGEEFVVTISVEAVKDREG